jgi:hypothetical protein
LALVFVHPLNTGARLSVTVTVNMQFPVLFDVSVAEQVTVVTPLAKAVPLTGAHVTVRAPSQLSVAVGWVKVTTAVQEFDAVKALWFAQPVTTGATLSVTVTVNIQVAVFGVGVFASEAMQVTVVTPLTKVEPAGGLQVTGRAPSQLSVAVGCV